MRRAEPGVRVEDHGLASDHDEREPGNENETNQGEQNDEREPRPGLGIGVVVVLLPVWLVALPHGYRPPSLRRGLAHRAPFDLILPDRAPLDPVLLRGGKGVLSAPCRRTQGVAARSLPYAPSASAARWARLSARV